MVGERITRGEIIVLRHAPANDQTRELLDYGRSMAQNAKEKVGRFGIVIASEMPRAQETAEILTGASPEVDERAGYNVVFSAEERRRQLETLAISRPEDSVHNVFRWGADVPEQIISAGSGLLFLLADILQRLDENGRALVISHNSPMEPAMTVFTGKNDRFFQPLTGFRVMSGMNVAYYTP